MKKHKKVGLCWCGLAHAVYRPYDKHHKELKLLLRKGEVRTVRRAKPKVELCYIKLGKIIKLLRKARSMTQDDFADKTHLTRGSIANIEVGRQRTPLHDLYMFARVLKVNPVALFREIS